MEARPPKLMTPFDSLVISDPLYTLKLLLPYTPPSAQRMLAVYIKFQEFRYTLEYFWGFPRSGSPDHLLQDLKPYMTPQERETMEQMEGMLNMMELMQEFPVLSGQEEDGAGSGGFPSSIDLIKHMLTPEQQELFHTYSTFFDDALASSQGEDAKGNKKGGSEHE